MQDINFEKITDLSNIIETRDTIRALFHKIKENVSVKKNKEKLKYLRSQLNFIKVFSSDSVQGTAGIITLKGLDNVPIVFKISNGVDYAIEHESQVLEDLKDIELFCPHFMSKYESMELPISSLFFKDPDPEKGFMEENSDYFVTSVLFTEYISRYSYYHYLMTGNKPIINSLIMQILCALHVSQTHSKLTHYDLHLDNILIRNCDENTIHIYDLDDKNSILVPTYGNVPVLIDMGSSYSKSTDKLVTSIEHYHHGLQSCIFDKFNDLHHLLLSTLSCLTEEEEEEDNYYNNVYYKLMCLFSPIPLWRNKGWKILDYDLVDALMYYLLENCEFVSNKDKRYAFKDYFEDVIESINAVVSLPFSEYTKEEIDLKLPKLWDSLFDHIYKIINFTSITNESECIYIIKEIASAYLNFKHNDIPMNRCIELTKNKLSIVLDSDEMKMLNIREMISIFSEIAPYLGGFYNIFLNKNMGVVNNAYKILEDTYNIKGVESVINYLRKQIPCNLDLVADREYIVYHFDSVRKVHKKKNIIFSEKECEIYNSLTNNDKSKYFKAKMI